MNAFAIRVIRAAARRNARGADAIPSRVSHCRRAVAAMFHHAHQGHSPPALHITDSSPPPYLIDFTPVFPRRLHLAFL